MNSFYRQLYPWTFLEIHVKVVANPPNKRNIPVLGDMQDICLVKVWDNTKITKIPIHGNDLS